nr:MAG TPA: tail tape measure protein [Caudoviricetes sp.]
MAGKSFGGSVKLTGESEYQKALNGIANNLRVLNSEMRVVTSQYDKNDNSSQKLKATSEVLNKKIAEQEAKVKVLKTALSKAEQETGKNSTTTKKWQEQLNYAESELNDLNRELKNQHGNLDKSSEKTLKLGDIIKGNLISQGIIAGIKGLGKAIGAIGSVFINVGKQAVQSYAQYEQLVGGIDTLFKESSAKMQEYANNAYKTAGLSANEYMETATAFSASLISSLGGDTEKSAEVANRAIIDMSDNANKMGTDMQSIQNAYQGFAKQNYAMLDNLKLGYGGNKTEMERLIADASKMTDVQRELGVTVAEGDLSFANIANAISVVQRNMGIMGTTALEASVTITGSTGSMKSAWKNLITGIADDNADFEMLVGNLVTSIVGKDGEGGFVNNMLPRIRQALNGIVKMVVGLTNTLLPQVVVIASDLIKNLASGISENLPALLESASTIVDTLIAGIGSLLPTLLPVAISLIETLVTSLLSNIHKIFAAGIQMIVTLAQGVASMLPTLIPLAVNAVLNLVETLLDNLDLVIDAGIALVMGLAEGVVAALPDFAERLPVIIDKLIDTVVNNLPKIIEMGGELIIKLAVGLVKAIPQLRAKVPHVIASLIGGFAKYYSKLGEVGKNLIKGLWDGILDAGGWLKDKISEFFGGIVDNIKSFFGIHSPSRLFKNEIGRNLALGIGEGFSDTMSDVSADMQGAIPTDFDTNINTTTLSPYGYNYDYLVMAFKEAFKNVKVVMNEREMGSFVVSTVEREVFA